jgi:flavin reductase (DIM6/NTAB) family NADH-FMN oxidoreductase RutF
MHDRMSEALVRLMESADGPLVVVTTVAEGERAGCVVGFHSQSGVNPARYSIWLSKANHTYRAMVRAEHFVVHFLGEGDVAVARHFGTRCGGDVDKFADIGWSAGPGGVPLLDHLPHRVVLRKLTMLDDDGDHVCVSGEVLDVTNDGAFAPLRLSAANHWEAGHQPAERAIEPTES